VRGPFRDLNGLADRVWRAFGAKVSMKLYWHSEMLPAEGSFRCGFQFMKFSSRFVVSFITFAIALRASTLAQLTLAPLVGFGGTDGWLSPTEGAPYLTTGATDRSIAYNPVTKNLYLASRAPVSGDSIHIRVLNSVTGADTGLELNDSIITGGTFPLNAIAAGSDGAIYAANLISATTPPPFTVYRWQNESAIPTVAFSGTFPGRLGDTFDVIGGGLSARIIAGESNSAGSGTRNSFVALSTADGSTFTGGLVAFPGPPPNAGDFRLGITFIDSDTVLGVQGGTGNPMRLVNFDAAALTGTLVASPATVSNVERGFDYAVVGGVPLLATMETNTNVVRIYDMTDPTTPVFLASGNNAGAFVAGATAGAGTSQMRWGEINGNTATLYASNTNNGIQAFVVTIPEPTSAALVVFATAALSARRRRSLH